MITQIDHIGIAVNSLEEHIPFYRDVLKFELMGYEDVPSQKVKVAFLKIGNVKLELLEATSPESPIAKHIEKKGEGMHHVAYRTDDVVKEIEVLKAQDIQLIDNTPRPGAHGAQIAFLHPKSSGKVLTELCQPGGTHE